ncbi:acetyltransferase [Paenibacillus sp. GCM10027628]|uniref:acetyltransferase n=1 Tax=Paenibacillus sp. GCM10027628 TaxID=3273413 RepID=UPI003632D9D3
MRLDRPVIVLGGGGHAKVVIDTLQEMEHKILGCVIAGNIESQLEVMGVAILGDDKYVEHYAPEEVFLINGIGSIGNSTLRKNIFEKFKQKQYMFLNVIHPNSFVSKNAVLGEGVQIMAGSVIQSGTIIGRNCIINTKASIDHDSKVENHVHIAPGAVLCGNVYIGQATHVGAGATIIQGIHVGSSSIVGAGSVVVKNVPDNTIVFGNPAKCKK